MDCPDIASLNLSEESKQGIKRIRRIPGLANALAGSMSASVVVSIFVSPTPSAVTIYGIEATDWRLFSNSLASVPTIAKASMIKEAQNQWAGAELRNNHPEAVFWKAVANGCKIR